MRKIQIGINERTYEDYVQKEDLYETTNLSSFQKVFKSIKIKYLKHKFLSNLRRNNINSKPTQLQIKKNQPPFFNIKGWYVNQSFSNALLLLDIIFTLINFIFASFQAFLTEYQDSKQNYPGIYLINILAVVIYILRIGVSLISIEIQNGVEYIYIIDIIKNEVKKGSFIIEATFATIFIFDASVSTFNLDKAIGIIQFILCLPKLYILIASMYKIQIWIINTLKRKRYWNLLKLFLYNIFIAHFMASLILATLYFQRERNWYDTKIGLSQNVHWFQLYLWAYYWACTIMITVGFGDFVPAIVEEAVVVSFLQILSSIIIAYNISKIGSIIQDMTSRNDQVYSKIGLLRRMNKENTVPQHINLKIQQFIVNQATIEEEFQYLRHHELINGLPQQLQVQYYKEAQKNIFGKLPFFVNLSTDILINFFMKSNGKVYYPGQYIIRNNFSEELTIILKGVIGFCCSKSDSILSESVIETLKINYSDHKAISINHHHLYRRQSIVFDVKSIKYSYGIKFSLQSFVSILKKNEADYHYYLMTLDSHQLNNSITIQKCQFCPFDFHTKFQCPKLHYIPFKSLIISKYNSRTSAVNYRIKKICKISFRRNRVYHSYLFKEKFREHASIVINLDRIAPTNLVRIVSNKELELNFQNFEPKSYEFLQLDQAYNFQTYFCRCNPNRLRNLAFLRKGYQKTSKIQRRQRRMPTEVSLMQTTF